MMIQYVEPLPKISKEQLAAYKIGAMELFEYRQTRIPTMNSHQNNNCGLLKISSQGYTGYGEYIGSSAHSHQDLVRWAGVFTHLKKLSLPEAYEYIYVHRQCWGEARAQLAESVLDDLTKQIINTSLGHSYDWKAALYQRSKLIERSTAYYSF